MRDKAREVRTALRLALDLVCREAIIVLLPCKLVMCETEKARDVCKLRAALGVVCREVIVVVSPSKLGVGDKSTMRLRLRLFADAMMKGRGLSPIGLSIRHSYWILVCMSVKHVGTNTFVCGASTVLLDRDATIALVKRKHVTRHATYPALYACLYFMSRISRCY